METKSWHKTIIAIGSNCDQDANISKAIDGLKMVVGGIRQSQIVQTKAVGGAVGVFKNAMLAGQTRLSLDELTQSVKRIERECGRKPDDKERGVIAVDIDIMEYDGVKLHIADWQRDYIKALLGAVL